MRFLIIISFVLTACNFDYAEKQELLSIEVVPLNLALIGKLNADAYKPKALPSALSRIASSDLPPKPAANKFTTIVANLPPAKRRLDYRLGPADLVTLRSPNIKQDTQIQGLLDAKARHEIYQVREDGTISVPGLAPIPVAGLSLKRAEEAVFDALLSENLELNLSFEVTGYHSQSASVSGAVAEPVIAPISATPLYLDQALQMAGGIQTSDPDRTIVRIYRDGEDFQVSARDALALTYGRVRLQDGDNIVVESIDGQVDPARDQAISEATTKFQIRTAQLQSEKANFQAKLELGAIQREKAYLVVGDTRPELFELPFDTRAVLADILSVADSDKNLRHVYILRGQKKNQKAYHIDLRAVGNFSMITKLELRPNDMILLSKSQIRNWNKASILGN